METIKSSIEISALFAQGKRVHTPYITLIVYKDCDRSFGKNGRIAFIAGKKNGNAVWRNSAKRRMRAVIQELQGPWEDYKLLLLAKPRILQVPFQEVCTELEKSLIKIGII